MKETNKTPKTSMRRKSTSIEGREDQLISKAVDLAEQKILDGTASNSLILHFLKLGTTKAQLEKEILVGQKKLIEAKTEALESTKHLEEMYTNAINAMMSYRYTGGDEEDGGEN